MSRFQPIRIPGQNINTPQVGEQSLTQTRFIAPKPNNDLANIVAGLADAVGIALDRKDRKERVAAKLTAETKDEMNKEAMEQLFSLNQQYNVATEALAAATASGDEALIAEANRTLLSTIKSINFDAENITGQEDIDFRIRQNAEGLSNDIAMQHSQKLNDLREAEDAEAEQSRLREVNKALAIGTEGLANPQVMKTIAIGLKTFQEEDATPTQIQEILWNMTEKRFSELVGENTGLEGAELQAYINEPEIQDRISKKTAELYRLYATVSKQMAREAEEDASRTLAVDAGRTLAAQDGGYNPAQIHRTADALGLDRTDVEDQAAFALVDLYGGGSPGFLAMDLEGHFEAMNTLSINGRSSETKAVADAVYNAFKEVWRTDMDAGLLMRKKIQDMYPSGLPPYLKRLDGEFFDTGEPLSPGSFRINGSLNSEGMRTVMNSTQQVLHGRATRSEAALTEALSTGLIPETNTGSMGDYKSQQLIFNDDGTFTPDGLKFFQDQVGQIASFYDIAAQGSWSRADKVNEVESGLFKAESVKEFGVAYSLFLTNSDVQERIFFDNRRDPEKLMMLRMLLNDDVLSNPMLSEPHLLIQEYQNRAMITNQYVDNAAMNKAIKNDDVIKNSANTADLGTPLNPEALGSYRLLYAQVAKTFPDASPAEIAITTLATFKSTHVAVGDKWYNISDNFVTQVLQPDVLAARIEKGISSGFYTDERFEKAYSTFLGNHVREHRWYNINNDIQFNNLIAIYSGYMRPQNEYLTTGEAIRRMSPLALIPGGESFDITAGIRWIHDKYREVFSDDINDGNNTYSKRDIIKAHLADRLSRDPSIRRQMNELIGYKDGSQLSKMAATPALYWHLASGLMGDYAQIGSHGIDVNPGQYITVGSNGQPVFALNFTEGSGFNSVYIEIPNSLIEELTSGGSLIKPKREYLDSTEPFDITLEDLRKAAANLRDGINDVIEPTREGVREGNRLRAEARAAKDLPKEPTVRLTNSLNDLSKKIQAVAKLKDHSIGSARTYINDIADEINAVVEPTRQGVRKGNELRNMNVTTVTPEHYGKTLTDLASELDKVTRRKDYTMEDVREVFRKYAHEVNAVVEPTKESVREGNRLRNQSP